MSITENSDPDAHGFMKMLGSKWGWQGTEEAFIPEYVMGKNPSAYPAISLFASAFRAPE